MEYVRKDIFGFWGLVNIGCVLNIEGGRSKHPEAEETAGKAGAGLRFCQSKVCLNLTVLLNLKSQCHVSPDLLYSKFIFILMWLLSPQFRWLQATKSIISGTNTQALTAKADLLKEEMDEAMNKVELCKVTSMCMWVYCVLYECILLSTKEVR